VKHIRYEDVDNSMHYGERYCIDWDKGERKYKEPFSGIKVYECGITEVTQSGLRNPYWRNHVAKEFDLHFVYIQELVGLTLHDPETGREVKKTSLDRGSVLHHYDLKRIYRGPAYRTGPLQFLSEHAQPTGCKDFVVYTRRKDKEAEVKARFAESKALGDTLLQVQSRDGQGSYEYQWRHSTGDSIINGTSPIPDPTTTKGQSFCRYLARNEENINARISTHCRDQHKVPFLIVKEK